jgi:hypothetical protein
LASSAEFPRRAGGLRLVEQRPQRVHGIIRAERLKIQPAAANMPKPGTASAWRQIHGADYTGNKLNRLQPKQQKACGFSTAGFLKN